MKKIKSIWGKRLIIIILSLGLISIGLVIIYWSVSHIRSQTVISNEQQSTNQVTWAAKNSTAYQPVRYAKYPSVGDGVGTLSIPALNQQWPIIEGTGDEELKNGVGHFIQSVLPGEKDNCVLSGHRDTVFSEIGKLKLKDKLIVKTAAGTFSYLISNIRIVDKDDRTVIVPTNNAVLTITTCYPFAYVGSAPKRYILVADLVKND